MFGRRKPANKILLVIDWDNLASNMIASVRNYSLAKGFKRLVEQLTQVGELSVVFVFGPPDSISKDLRAFHDEGFWPIPCPRETEKRTGDSIDVVDSKIVAFVRDMLELMPDLTHICIGSGDGDFIKPLVKVSKRRGKKIMVVSGKLRSLSQELKDLADEHPLTGERMVFLFSPTTE